MTTQPAEIWRALLRRSLMTARKQRDTVRVSALRSALAAIDNAETPDEDAIVSLGGAEVARRVLSDEQIRSIVRSEIDERLSAAFECTAGGRADRAATLRAEASVLTALLGDV